MYICICHAVTDCDIRKAVAQGASSVEMISEHLNVSTNCGRCLERAHQVVQEAISQEQLAMDVTPLVRPHQSCPIPYYGDRRQAS